eukprot:215969-Rhodomonas_salina.3
MGRVCFSFSFSVCVTSVAASRCFVCISFALANSPGGSKPALSSSIPKVSSSIPKLSTAQTAAYPKSAPQRQEGVVACRKSVPQLSSSIPKLSICAVLSFGMLLLGMLLTVAACAKAALKYTASQYRAISNAMYGRKANTRHHHPVRQYRKCNTRWGFAIQHASTRQTIACSLARYSTRVSCMHTENRGAVQYSSTEKFAAGA